MENKVTIGPMAFLVSGDNVNNEGSKIVSFLRKEGFKRFYHHYDYSKCPWIYININEKSYSYGIPGIKITDAIGNHAIRESEFYIIYNIYKQYEGKDLFVFKERRFDYND